MVQGWGACLAWGVTGGHGEAPVFHCRAASPVMYG